jgi:hypothetical protein
MLLVRAQPGEPINPNKKGRNMAKKMSEEARRDKIALLYLKENKITDISQVTHKHRVTLYSILNGGKY